MTSARSLHTFNRRKKMNCIVMQGCLLVDSHKSAGSGPARSPVSCPIKKKTNTKNKSNQANKTQPQPNQTKKNTEKWDCYLFLWSAPVAFRPVALETSRVDRDSNHHRQSDSAGKTNAIPTEPSGRLRSGIATSCQNNIHDDILCQYEYGHEKEAKPKNTEPHKEARQEGDRSNKAQCGNQGSPPARISEIREQPFQHNVHPNTSKQTTTTPCRNESGEKRIKGETGGEK